MHSYLNNRNNLNKNSRAYNQLFRDNTRILETEAKFNISYTCGICFSDETATYYDNAILTNEKHTNYPFFCVECNAIACHQCFESYIEARDNRSNGIENLARNLGLPRSQIRIPGDQRRATNKKNEVLAQGVDAFPCFVCKTKGAAVCTGSPNGRNVLHRFLIKNDELDINKMKENIVYNENINFIDEKDLKKAHQANSTNLIIDLTEEESQPMVQPVAQPNLIQTTLNNFAPRHQASRAPVFATQRANTQINRSPPTRFVALRFNSDEQDNAMRFLNFSRDLLVNNQEDLDLHLALLEEFAPQLLNRRRRRNDN